ncbi:MAG: dihydroxyacetone kinase subunit L [Anaerolineaceae bacterium]|nr:dihydroxyacetone kinase subunit L [Anaerolineaceae bacterium]
MANEQIDLFSLFKQVSKSVKQNKTSLNQADPYNHDHGDNMVEIFDVITRAMKEKKTADPADQLEYAAQLLRSKTGSGSGQVYASGLESAAKQVLGKDLNIGTIMTIIQSLMGSTQQPNQQTAQTAGSDMIGSLMGQLLGGAGKTGAGSSGTGQGLDLTDLLGAGMNYMSAKQSGKSDIEAITGALMSGSTMAQTPYRAQSGEVVTSALLKALTSMLKK